MTSAVLLGVFAELRDYGVPLDAIVLKPNMILPGSGSGGTMPPGEVASRTADAFSRIVPEEVAGIAFLSGGQGPDAATANLPASPSPTGRPDVRSCRCECVNSGPGGVTCRIASGIGLPSRRGPASRPRGRLRRCR